LKTFVSILLLISFTTHNPIRKRGLPYGIVISKADLIVDGKISNIQSNEYELEIDEFLKGESSRVIKVKMWKEWTCDRRIEKTEIGQRLILFLTDDKNGKFEIINGSTGELIVRKDNSVNTFTNLELPSVSETKSGIQKFIQAFEYSGNLYPKYNDQNYFKQLIEQSEIDKLMAKNIFFKTIVLSIKRYEIK